MTERKPPGLGFESWIERQIGEATNGGDVSGLPGAGSPFRDLDRPYDELWWIKQKLEREHLAYLPPSLALRAEVVEAMARAMAAASEAELRRIVAEVNERVVEATRKPLSGPPLDLVPFDVERVVQSWRERQPRSRP